MSSEKLNFNIGNFSDKYLSERERYLRQKSKIKVFTLDEVKDFVLKQQLSDEIKEELIVLLNKYPHAAYNNFIQNINKNIQIIMENRKEYLKSIHPEKKVRIKSNDSIKDIKFEDFKDDFKDDDAAKDDDNANKESKNSDSSSKSVLDELKEELT
jgi:hypothetical protein